ncbi:CarboxypepD_reg-like domain-containing protein [Lutibacter flavus]|uniref:CarboxypepD_reg-like domain-containing protein n=2 Tax=Lutibacter flavus TaxID=691689 RepID=A0A238X314_9FLAO|nr:CarboxypepD_reg-like domain-containing protein [Lutibacter flavus]
MRVLIVTFFLLIITQNFGQSLKMSSLTTDFNKKGNIEGVVFDGENENEPLIFAQVLVKETNTTATTDVDGSFRLKLKPGKYSLKFSFIGYNSIEINNVKISSNSSLKLYQVLNALKPKTSISEGNLISKAK